MPAGQKADTASAAPATEAGSSVHDGESSWKEVVFDFVAGSISGCASIAIGHPFDVVKVRLQVQPERYPSAIGCVRDTVRTEGVRALFRGMAPPLLTASFINAIVFAIYGGTIRYITVGRGQTEPPSLTQIAFAGGVAGVFQTLVLSPADLLKCRLQLQTDKSFYKGPWDCMRKTVRNAGVRGLYLGWCVTCYREVPSFAIYFSSYEATKQALSDTNLPAWASAFVAGGIAGALTWTGLYPIDMAKSVIQTLPDSASWKERSCWYQLRRLYKNHGATHLWRGLGTTILRAIPVNGVIFPIYEGLVHFMRKWF